jgi:flagellar assembly factor FliW
MEILTRAYGKIEINEEQKIIFPRGLYGFEAMSDFALIVAEKEPFFYLQSMTDENIAFVIIDPFIICPDYEADVDNTKLAEIGIYDPREALLFAIVTIHQDGAMTVNLQGPLIVNKKNKLGRQTILLDPQWKTQHKIGILEKSC